MVSHNFEKDERMQLATKYSTAEIYYTIVLIVLIVTDDNSDTFRDIRFFFHI